MQQSRAEGKLPRVTLKDSGTRTPGDGAGRFIMNPSLASSQLARAGIGLLLSRGLCFRREPGA
jgi:hypothetical protein